jgi:hypothetical protein
MWPVLRRALIVAPCRTYKFVGSAQGSVPYPVMLTGVLVAALAGALWAVVAMVSGADRGDAFWWGAIGGLFLCISWLLYSIIVIGILWLTGRNWSHIAADRNRRPQR